jgi:hypothetical protein
MQVSSPEDRPLPVLGKRAEARDERDQPQG